MSELVQQLVVSVSESTLSDVLGFLLYYLGSMNAPGSLLSLSVLVELCIHACIHYKVPCRQ